MRKFILFSLFGVILLIQACVKDNDFEFDKIASANWNPDLAVPLIHTEMSIQDIIGTTESDIFSVDSNHLVSLIYRGNIYSMSGSGFLSMVDQNDNTPFTINTGDSIALFATNSLSKTIPKIVPFIFPGGQIIDSLYFKTGTLEIRITSTVPHSGTLNVSIPDMLENGYPFNFNVPFNACTGTQIIKIDSTSLIGNSLDLTSTGMPGIFHINYTATFNNSSSATALTNKNFVVESNFTNINFSSIFGNLGSTVMNMDEDSSQITLFDNFQNGELFFEDPKLTFTITNSIGMPIDAHLASFNIITKAGTTIPISGGIPDPLPVSYPTQAGQFATSSFILDKSNSNIQEIISEAPQYFVYSLNATSNVPSVPFNFLTDSSQLKADIMIDFPLRGYASGFLISDTVEFELQNIEGIDSATFRINVDNGFPASAYTQIYFADSNYVVLDSMLINPSALLVESAQVDANGKVTQPTHKMIDEPFSKLRLNHLFTAKKLLIVSVIDTKDAPNSLIEIYDYYKMDVKIGVRASYNLKF